MSDDHRDTINNLRKKNGYSQEQFASLFDMAQSRVSRIFSKNSGNDFTVLQLIAIAKHFHVSLDSLLGNEPTPEPEKPITLAEIAKSLFFLDNSSELTVDFLKDGRPYICFDNQNVNDFITEWKKIASVCETCDKDTQRVVFDSWKDSFLRKAESCTDIASEQNHYYGLIERFVYGELSKGDYIDYLDSLDEKKCQCFKMFFSRYLDEHQELFDTSKADIEWIEIDEKPPRMLRIEYMKYFLNERITTDPL